MPFPKPRSRRAQMHLTYMRRLDICLTIHGNIRRNYRSAARRMTVHYLAYLHDVSPSTIRTIHRHHCLKTGSLPLPRWAR
jgi:hypothetical protein